MICRYNSDVLYSNTGLVRIKIPKNIHKKIENKFIRIKLDNSIEFFYKASKENRLVIPRNLAKKIEFMTLHFIELKEIYLVKKTKNKSKIHKGVLNLINFIPVTTRNGLDINILPKKKELVCFYKNSNGMLRYVEIKKEVSLEFCRFLGYYQAEGSKEKRVKGFAGRQVVFTNTNLHIIVDFINLSCHLISTGLWKVELKVKKRNVEKECVIKNILKNCGINEENIKVKVENNIKDFSIRLYICSTIFSDIIIGLMENIKRDIMSKKILDGDCLKMYVYFMQGLFAGDGNYSTYKNAKSGIHHRLIFYEQDKKYALQYSKLLKKIGINNKLIKERRNMFIVRATLNWEKLLLIKELGLFNYHDKHKISLINSIKNHKIYKSHKYLKDLNGKIDISTVQKVIKKNKTICYNWLKKMVNKKIILKRGINKWVQSSEGQRIKRILLSIENNS